ncbi:helix-turn-helix domain-containing protein [Actinomadura madurae]|uniref:helix-turn-helix domain-containing protein n=1 Tax=Actinomadura madurae TaxID=1993 RepID=UPI0020275570|nr:helix-turn-helix transcriptional regulator [Actinomadura madurae]URM97039.1 helix-turn-helix domain-containing protein [Actinomadura madurae]URN07821.1 helix-turn-helix domain-containing protein [Actinomadura madurae]
MSRTRPPTPLPGDLPEAVRVLLTELRGLKEESGLDLRALERRTHASRSSWGRWLSGETWIPADAVASLADLCGADAHRLAALWEVADEARRAAPPTPAGTTGTADTIDRANTRDTAATVSAPSEPPPHRTGRHRRLLFLGAVVACTFVAGTAGVALGASLRTPPVSGDSGGRPPGATGGPVGAITRQDVIARSRSWHPHGPRRVPYDQAAGHQGYRTDGSGYASMALGLPKPGPNSALLEASYCRQIPMPSLRPGDLVIKSSGGADVREVLIFERWTSGARTAYWAYQQRRGYGTDHLVRRDGLARGSDHRACRPRNIQDDPVG